MNDDHVPAYPAEVTVFPTVVRLPKSLRRRASVRCHCGRPVLATSLDGINCSEHDQAASMRRHPSSQEKL